MKKLIFSLLSISFLFFAGCKDKDDEDIEKPVVTTESDTVKVNRFILDYLHQFYLWESETNWNNYEQTYKDYKDPHELFDEFIYEKDYWSWLTDDIDAIFEQVIGVTTSYGYELIRGRFSNTGTYFAIILYIHPNTPAEKSGLKRGDILVKINDSDITDSNYNNFYNSSNIKITKGYIGEDNSIYTSNETVSMTAVEMYLNPIVKDSVIIKGNHKIAYLCYTDYQELSDNDLISTFTKYKLQGATDVVLDLRYNGGGSSNSARILSSILAPFTAVRNKDIYLTQKWNNWFTQYWKERGEDLNEYFIDTLSVNMNLKRLFVLTSEFTASASEATILGLMPYLDLIEIGNETAGKYYGGYIYSIPMLYEGSDYKEGYFDAVSNWGSYAMSYRFDNKNKSNFEGGILPKIQAEENYFNLFQFGDEKDPLLGRALEQITGEQYVEARNAKIVNKNYNFDKKSLEERHKTGMYEIKNYPVVK
ncbi:MAG: hypothetical protein LBE91_11505 [Tannerella sp.]|nr:hypothetical protein [Tannerella sp.]